jgi:hypothetical protein
LKTGKPSFRPGMVLPLLLIILFLGSLLAAVSMTEVERTARVGQSHIDQAMSVNEGLSAIGRGRAWLSREMSETGDLPRWLENSPAEDGILSLDEWNAAKSGILRVYEEERIQGPLVISLEVFDLDYRYSSALEKEESLPPCLFDYFSLFGGIQMVDPLTEGHLLALGDVALSGDILVSMEEGKTSLSGKGQSFILFEEDGEGHSLSSPNGETRIVFSLSGTEDIFPEGLDLGFRLDGAEEKPEEGFLSGYSVSFSVEDPLNPENRDRLLLKRNGSSESDGPEEILSRIPFPYCRSLNVQDQERYRTYLSAPHEILLRFENDLATVVLDPGKGNLEKRLETVIETPSRVESVPALTGLRVRSKAGATTHISSLRIHPADGLGYFRECKEKGFYLVRVVVRTDDAVRTFETILSSDLASRKVQELAWEVKPCF